MILFLAFVKMMWEIWLEDFNLFGKIIFFPLFFIGTLCMLFFGLFELVLIDPLVVLMVICSKSLTLGDVFDFY